MKRRVRVQVGVGYRGMERGSRVQNEWNEEDDREGSRMQMEQDNMR